MPRTYYYFVVPAMGPTGMSYQILPHCVWSSMLASVSDALLDPSTLVLFPSMKIWPTYTGIHLHGENLGLFWPRSVGDTAAAGDTPPAAHGGGTRAIAGVLVHEDLPAPALLAAERPVASVHVDVHALGELSVAEAAALQLQEGARGRRRDRDSDRDLLLLVAGTVDHEGGLADDLRRRRLPGVALAVGLQENTQPGHGARSPEQSRLASYCGSDAGCSI